MSDEKFDKPTQDLQSKEPQKPVKASQGPIVPTCDSCKRPFTSCKCTHNDLKK